MTSPRSDRHTPPRRLRGFTLIELMVTVAIIAILAGIALPAYTSYVTRGKLVALTNNLAAYRTAMEQFYQDNRSYVSVTSGSTTITSPCSDTTNWAKSWGTYTLSCTPVTTTVGTTTTTTGYLLTASGTSGAVNGAQYTVNQANTMATVSFPTSWGGTANLPSTTNCWLMKKGDSC